MSRRIIFIMLLLSFACALAAGVPTAIAIRNARVVTVSGPVYETGTVLVRDGLVESVGEGIAVPPDAWVIDGEGLTVYPGLIDALSTWGIPKSPSQRPAPDPTAPNPPVQETPAAASPSRGPEDRPMNTSWARAADLVQPSDTRLEAARNSGFTTAATFPDAGIFSGQGAIVNLAGESAGSMVVHPNAGQRLALRTSGGSAFPASLMGTMAYIRQIYLDAEQYAEAKAIYAAGSSGMKRPDYDRALEGVLASPRILLPATLAHQVKRMLRLADKLGQETILYGLHEGYGVAGLLKERDIPVLVSLKWPKRADDADPEREDALRVLELRERAPSTPKALSDAGVRWAFYSGELDKPADVIAAVRLALDAGLSQEAAVRALTLNVAEIYGVADRLGSVEPGKIANLVVTDGPLFEEKTEVKHVFVDGVKFTPEPRPAEKKEAQ